MSSRILIVDDSLTVRMDLQDAFEEAGFETTACADLAAARNALATRPYSLIVLDVLLPDGDGIELLRSIKGNPESAHIPCLLLSSEAEVRDRVRGLTMGAADYVGKPYDRGYVIDRSRELLQPAAASPIGRIAPLVLLIDDSVTFREEMRQSLESMGYAVHVSGSGEEGLRLAVQLRPDVVVVDGQLPGIDGATVIRRLRTDTVLGRTPCLLLTGSENKTDELLSLESGADTFLRKDASNEVILARLVALLRAASPLSTLDREGSLFGPKRVLAVDDSATFLQELSEALRAENFEVIQARSGVEALDLLAVQSVDCILLDLVMPELSGDDTCRRIKSMPELRDTPVVVLTAKKEQDTILSCLSAGADDFVPKSGDFELLIARMRAQLRRRQFEEENRLTKEVTSRLRKNETMLRALFEFAPDAVLVIDRDGKIVRANGQVEVMFGFSRSELVDRPVDVLMPTRYRERHAQHLVDFFASPRMRVMGPNNEFWGLRKDGSEFPVDIVLGPVQTDDGLLVLATIRDVTERKRAEAELFRKDEEVREVSRQLWQATKLATMGELAASIAHELNNPLTTVSLRLESLMESLGPDNPETRNLQIVEREIDRMANLVANLLHFSRVGHNQMSTVDVCEEIDTTIELVDHYLRKNDVTLIREYAEDLPSVVADSLKLRQLYLNVLVNASDAMPNGGTLTIRVHCGHLSENRPAIVQEFVDTGIGIAPEHISRVLDPFFTTKPEGKGTGLGLAICRRIAEEHEGTFDLSSELGNGTTIRLKLPAGDQQRSNRLFLD